MARFNVSGMGDIMETFVKAGRIGEEESWRVVSAGARVLEALYASRLAELFRVVTGSLSASVKTKRASATMAVLTPMGKHPHTSAGKRRKKKNGKSHGSYQGTNAEIAFILEYGSERIPATHWMEKTNEEAEEPVHQAMAEEWNKILDELGL